MVTIEQPGDVRAGKPLGAGEIVITRDMLERYDVAVGGTHVAVEAERATRTATAVQSPGSSGATCPVAILALQPFRFTGYRLADRQDAMNARVAWEFGRPLRLGEAIRLSATVVERAIKGWRERVTFEMTGVDGSGAVVLRARPTVSYRAPGAVRPEWPAGTTGTASPAVAADELTPYTRTLTVEMSRAIFFDVENYHTDTASARALGFSDVVIGGPHLFSLVSESLTGSLGRRWTHGGRINLAFVRPVVVGDTVTVRAALLPGGAAAATDQALAIRIENQRGETVTVGEATVGALSR